MNETPRTDVRVYGTMASGTSGWMKFLGVLSVLQGVLAVFTLWGILVCWLPIWLGVILFRAAEDAEAAAAGAPGRLESFLQRLNRYFLIQGIVALLGIVGGVIVFFAVGMAFLSGLFR